MIPEISTKAFITVKIGDNDYSLFCSNSANLGEAYRAWQEIGNWIVGQIQKDLESRKPQEATAVPSEDPKPS